MQRQIKLLAGYALCNFGNLNRIRHTKDKKLKQRWTALLIVWIFVILMMLFYIAALDFGLISLGLTEAVPIYSAVLGSMLVLVVTAFQAPGILFGGNDYDFLSALPLKRSSVIAGRMIALYLPELAFSVLAVFPGLILYGAYNHSGALYWINGCIGTLFLPMLPITIAVLIGTVIAGISSGMKHKSLIASVLSLFVVVAVIAGSMLLLGQTELDADALRDLVLMLRTKIAGFYPPALWFSDAMTQENVLKLLLFSGVSLAAFAGMIAIVSRFFPAICERLRTHAHGKKFKGETAGVQSPLKALFRKEICRYFASSVYVTNTAVGYILMALLSGALYFVGVDSLEPSLGMPGMVRKAFPFLLGATAAITTTTSCSISLEGKQWWMVQTLPLRSRDVLMSKILVNYTVAAPFFAISAVFSCLAAGKDVLFGLWSVAVPAVYIIFMAEAGLAINLKFTVFDWENETNVVKQGSAVLFTMLAGFISFLLPLGILFGVPGAGINLVSAVSLLVLLALAWLLHKKNGKTNLSSVGM